MFVTIDEPTLACHYHTKSTERHRSHSWCYRVYSSGQMYDEMCKSILMVAYSVFSLPKIPLWFTCLSLPPQSLKHSSIYCLHSFAFSRTSCSWNHAIYSYFRLASFTCNMHLHLLYVFSDLIAHIFSALDNIPLSRWTQLTIHLHKDISLFRDYKQSCCKHLCAGSCVHLGFQFLLVNTKKHSCWILWQKYVTYTESCLPRWLYHFAFSPAMDGSLLPCFLTSIWCVVSALDFGLSDRCVVIIHCFHLHLPDGIQCGVSFHMGFPSGSVVKNLSANSGFDPWVRKIPRRRKWQPTPVFLPGKCHEQRSPLGYSPQVRERVGCDLRLNNKSFQMLISYMYLFHAEVSIKSLTLLKNCIVFFVLNMFICFWLCWIFVAVCKLSLAVVGGSSLVMVCVLIVEASLVAEHGFEGEWASTVAALHAGWARAQWLWCKA